MRVLPNVVLIMADDMGCGDVTCINAESMIPTLNIDRIAENGIVLTNAHAPAGICTPTRYALLTGEYQFRLEAERNCLAMPYWRPKIGRSVPTIATLMQQAGYATACVGKWHLGLDWTAKDGLEKQFTEVESEVDFSKPFQNGPTTKGFDYFFGSAGCSTSDAPYCYLENGHTVGIPNIQSSPELNALPGFFPGLMTDYWDITEVDVDFTHKAVEYIAQRATLAENRPFFLYYGLSAPHNPWVVPEFCQGKSNDGSRGDMNVLVDWCVGQVYDALEKHDLLNDTLFIFTSDNGPQYHTGPHGHKATNGLRGHKNQPFEGGHREPFIASWPGYITPGSETNEEFNLIDMMASLAELVGLSENEHPIGQDSLPALSTILGTGHVENRPALVAHAKISNLSEYAITKDGYNLVFRPHEDDKEEFFLFDLAQDPFQENNLAAKLPDVLEQMKKLLNKIKKTGLRELSRFNKEQLLGGADQSENRSLTK